MFTHLLSSLLLKSLESPLEEASWLSLVAGFSDFSRLRSKGSRFTLGVWGLRVCSLDVAFLFATVRNRSQPFV